MVFDEQTDDQPAAKRRKIIESSSPPSPPTTSSASTSYQGHFDQTSFDSFMSQIMMSNASNATE